MRRDKPPRVDLKWDLAFLHHVDRRVLRLGLRPASAPHREARVSNLVRPRGQRWWTVQYTAPGGPRQIVLGALALLFVMRSCLLHLKQYNYCWVHCAGQAWPVYVGASYVWLADHRHSLVILEQPGSSLHVRALAPLCERLQWCNALF